MSKLRPAAGDDGAIRGYVFHCPGCDHGHIFYTAGPVAWDFNGRMDSPTFTPSLKNTCANHPDPKQRCCHLNLTDGRVTFHGDCTHDWAGKTYDLPEIT